MPVVGIDFGLFSEPARGQVFILAKRIRRLRRLTQIKEQKDRWGEG